MGQVGPSRPRHEPGSVIAGKYRVQRTLGEGGMGEVLVAWHDLLDVPVAIKLLSADLRHNTQSVSRFLREAQAVARLKSEHVARVMDMGTTEDGQPFIVMELLDGEDLENRLRRGPLPVAVTADFVLQAIEALAQAHAVGIVHRDLKPANLFAAASPGGHEVLKVLDFGVAKLVQGASDVPPKDQVLTGEHATVGSPCYMAPEQVRGDRVDARTDIWALGAIVYELLTGRTAFVGGSTGEVFGAILHTSPPPLRALSPDVPAGLEAVVARCLQREAADRYADLGELARAVAPFGSGAYEGYASRVEQTLRRASVLFDADATMMTRLRTLDAAGLAAAGFLFPAGSPPLPIDEGPASTENAVREVDTLPAPAPPRRFVRLALVAIAIASAGVAAAFLRGARPSKSPPIAATSVVATGPSATTSEASSLMQGAAPPLATLPSAPPSAARPAPATSQPRPAPTRVAKPRESRPALPGVLRSAD